ncbi:MAG: PQQ-binding-like beta-propeller repeat protein [Bryobacteraceae bacterium]|nr:PQQ-binding-like beta-propeller repeat protein [Bryobacteraceae bacterium]
MTKRILQFTCTGLLAVSLLAAGDWNDYRGPRRDGTSDEKGLPNSWSPAGDNLAWKLPLGGRSTPVVHGNRLYMLNTAGKGATLTERVAAIDVDTGKLVWEHLMPVYQSDVPPHRAAWASPAVDPETGNIYAIGVGGYMVALNAAGKLVWKKSIVEEYGLVTTHGGRTSSPVIFADLVIVSSVSTGWGEQARPATRFFAMNKKTGEMVWISAPGGRPFDTTYSPAVIAEVNGMKMFIAGNGDGGMHGMKPLTGEPIWSYVMSKRGINTGAVVLGKYAVVSHSEENLDTSEMGQLAAIDISGKGPVKAPRWVLKGFQGGYSSPVMDGDRVYQVDNGANLFAFDFHTGKQLWQHNLGTIQKASPVWADGKLYVGTENGKFLILRPHSDKCEVVDEDQLPGSQEQVIASAAVSRGRVYVVSTDAIYAIGKKRTPGGPDPYKPEPAPPADANAISHVQIVPAEVIVKPGETVQFKARLFDQMGRFYKEDTVEWTVEGARGTVANGTFKADSAPAASAGVVKGKWKELTGQARVRVIPPLPWSEDFESIAPGQAPRTWTNVTNKYVVREVEGKKVLVKLADNAFTKRARVFMGPTTWSNYTVEAEVMATEKRRQMGDAGVVAQRYQLALFGNHQRLELQAWQPETERTALTDFKWTKDTWYRLKLEVQNMPDGKVRARGKAWAVGEPEPDKWLLERIDPLGNKEGSPGIYADAPFEVFFDNLKVTPNSTAGTKVAARQ